MSRALLQPPKRIGARPLKQLVHVHRYLQSQRRYGRGAVLARDARNNSALAQGLAEQLADS
jgi:hypothetical protein